MAKSILWFAAGLFVAIGVLGGAWAATSGDAEVRINARRRSLVRATPASSAVPPHRRRVRPLA
ncbi:MAG: hypothetical protein OXH13_08430 [Chloroflexi bacterium]|nr:hypothetical protein [Chloroflexota bacterium]MCY3697495.1 hypothetical protein [Chloroflexota bacterium]